MFSMATRIAARYVSRRMSSSGKVLSEEEKAAENVYIRVRLILAPDIITSSTYGSFSTVNCFDESKRDLCS